MHQAPILTKSAGTAGLRGRRSTLHKVLMNSPFDTGLQRYRKLSIFLEAQHVPAHRRLRCMTSAAGRFESVSKEAAMSGKRKYTHIIVDWLDR
jgi:hypothetical protein